MVSAKLSLSLGIYYSFYTVVNFSFDKVLTSVA